MLCGLGWAVIGLILKDPRTYDVKRRFLQVKVACKHDSLHKNPNLLCRSRCDTPFSLRRDVIWQYNRMLA